MTIMRLNDVLGETLENLHSAEGSTDAFETSLKKAEFEAKIAKQIINGADVTLRADKLVGRTDRIDKVVGD